MTVVFDTNVYISGILFPGYSRQAIELLIEGKVQVFISKEIINEIESVLTSKKFNFENEKAEYITNEIEGIAQIIKPSTKVLDVCRDEKDHIILECAIESKSEFIVTGDNDLLVLQEFMGIRIIKVREFLEMI
jgi:putative PIN family toxin of toxin-antitoxin system